MMSNIIVGRVAVHLTWRCTLRCEKCGAFIPKSYEKGLAFDYDYTEIKQSLTTLFEMVDTVNVITLTGGEAILHKNIVELCEFLFENENKFNRVDCQTNGTILFSEELLKAMSKSDKFRFFIDHYGPDISTKVEENVSFCEKMGVRYQVRKYYGEDAHMNGWIDWSPRKEKLDVETAKKQFSICANGRPDSRPFVLYGKLLTLCAMPFCRYRIGAQPLEDVLLLDLSNDQLSLQEKRERLLEMRDTEINPGCRYCSGIGVDANAKRYKAGEQVKSNKYKKIIQLIQKIRPYAEINECTQLLDDGILDSMAIFAFVTLLEDRFNVEIPDDAITKDNFATIEKVISLLQKLIKHGEENDC